MMEKIIESKLLHICKELDDQFRTVQETIDQLDRIHWEIDMEKLWKIEYQIIGAIKTLESLIAFGELNESDLGAVKNIMCIGYRVYAVFELKMGINKPKYKSICVRHVLTSGIKFREFALTYNMTPECDKYHDELDKLNRIIKPSDNLMAN